MSSQSFNNNNYATTPTFPNSYISRKLNNINQVQVIKREQEDWTRIYHKMLKGIEAMIDVQRIIKDMKKLAKEVNIMMTEIEGLILTASINHQMTNAIILQKYQKIYDTWFKVIWKIKYSKSKECWQMNWIDIKEEVTHMWMKTYEKFKNCILTRNKHKRTKEG